MTDVPQFINDDLYHGEREPTDRELAQASETREQTLQRLKLEKTVDVMDLTISELTDKLSERENLLIGARFLAADAILLARILSEREPTCDEDKTVCGIAMSAIQSCADAIMLHVGDTFEENENWYRGSRYE